MKRWIVALLIALVLPVPPARADEYHHAVRCYDRYARLIVFDVVLDEPYRIDTEAFCKSRGLTDRPPVRWGWSLWRKG